MNRILLSLVLFFVSGFVSGEQSNELARTLQINYANQTGAIAQVTELSPSVDTGYIVTMHTHMNGSQTGTASFTPTFLYTDTNGFTEQIYPSGASVSEGTSASVIAFIYVKGGTNVTFSTSYNGGTDNPTYDLTFTLFQQ